MRTDHRRFVGKAAKRKYEIVRLPAIPMAKTARFDGSKIRQVDRPQVAPQTQQTRQEHLEMSMRVRATARITANQLNQGKAKSCGCLRLIFAEQEKNAYEKRKKVFEDGKWWFAPGHAAKYSGEEGHTLNDWKKSCPWLPEKTGLEIREFPTAFFDRPIEYLARIVWIWP